MVHELIGTSNNIVDLTGREDVPDEMRKVTLSADSDEFYRHNMYANFGEIGQTIKSLVQKFQETTKGHSKLDSIGDIKDFVASYPEFKKMSGTVSKHVALVGELSKEVRINGLLEVSEFEQNIACGHEKDNSIAQLQQLLALPTIRTKDALRLVALYTIRYGRDVEKNLELLCRSVKGNQEVICSSDDSHL
jgi:vacuolar protein sorting-associated protein 45